MDKLIDGKTIRHGSETTTAAGRGHHKDAPSEKRQQRNLTIGEVIPLTPDMTYQLGMLLESRVWPKSQRESISGFGITHGVETNSGIPRLSPSTDKETELLRVLNGLLDTLLGARQFRWSTIRVDKNSVARPQVAMDQIAPSVHLLMGDFKGGTFRTVDGTIMLNETNKLIVYDPRKPHLSERFSGTRYAITYS